MENKRKSISFFVMLMIFASFTASSQSKGRETIYFLADTINAAKDNRVLSIETEAQKFVVYEFFCKCMPDYESNVSLYYEKPKEESLFNKKPDLKYISWRDLSNLFAKHANRFDGFYQLEIIEVLPNGKFLRNKVKLAMQHITRKVE